MVGEREGRDNDDNQSYARGDEEGFLPRVDSKASH